MWEESCLPLRFIDQTQQLWTKRKAVSGAHVPRGHSWEEGLEATPGAMSGRQRLVTNLRQGPFPTPMTPLGAVANPLPSTPAPPATPLPLSFLPTRLDFSKTKCDTAHHPQTLQHTNPVGGKQPFLPCESWAAGQRQENSSTNRHIITAAGPEQQLCRFGNRSPHPRQTAGEPRGWGGDPEVTQPGTGVWDPQKLGFVSSSAVLVPFCNLLTCLAFHELL